jgi:hypothetical protein
MLVHSSFTTFTVVAIAVWRVTHLLWGEDGPADIFVRLRRLAGSSFIGRLLDCFYCLSLWVAAPFAWLMESTWKGRGIIWLGLSGGAILFERVTSAAVPPPPAKWHETMKPEDPDQ